MSRIEILRKSLEKKETILSQRFDNHFADVARANGQPLNDKRNGRATLNRWDKQSDAIRNAQKEIEKTKNAIEREENKIAHVERVNETLPEYLFKLCADGVLNQWRKHPNTFFVPGVDKVRYYYDEKDGKLYIKYLSQCDPEQRPALIEANKKIHAAKNAD